jgi:hypothetical protein
MHFDHPRDVLMADNISKDEKRAILASWASDICAIESIPAWRRSPGTMDRPYDDFATLKAIDGDDQSASAQKPMASINDSKSRRRRPLARRSGGGFKKTGSGAGLPRIERLAIVKLHRCLSHDPTFRIQSPEKSLIARSFATNRLHDP